MKVYMRQKASPGVGGIARVLDGMTKHLPVEFVDTMEQADVVHSHIALFEHVPYDKPLVVSSHGMLWHEDKWGTKGAWKVNQACVEGYLQADVVTAPSHFVANAVARHTLVNAKVVHHGIDVEEWEPRADTGGYILWNKSRADAACTPLPLMLLAERAPGIKFVSTFGTQTPNVDVIGHQEYDDMKEWVLNAGVYLVTPKESGGPCFGVLEAMAAGVPVLSWNYGGTAEVVQHTETGYLAQPGNYDDLLSGLHYCINNRSRMGANARQFVVDNFQWKDVVGGYLNAYELAIKKQSYKTTVSVIVPCYNLGKYLTRCVDSVLAQTYQDLEVIIVNDASTDDTDATARELLKKDSRVRYVNNIENRHVADARNLGITHSSGRYILPLDADDALFPNALADMVGVLNNKREIQMASGKLILFHESDMAMDNGQGGAWPNNADPKLQLQGHNRLPYASMYRRSVWEDTGGYRRRIRTGIEDADFWTRAFSYGRKAEIIDYPTLKYTIREQSLSRENPSKASDWLGWFPWAYDENLQPMGMGEAPAWSYNPPKVSVVIPVGPGHEHHIQTCVDSVIASTFHEWEIVLVNDTGKKWFDDNGESLSFYTNGLSLATVVDKDTSEGVIVARNRGIDAAKASRVVFLDVDDVLQPEALGIMYAAHRQTEGWLYGDWYHLVDGNLVYNEAPDWSTERFAEQSLAPITGIYSKADLMEVGGFSEDTPGWEDWELQLKLVELGICGTRIAYPLIVYHMDLGWRREDNFSRQEDIVQYIQQKHDLERLRKHMACKRCGGKRTVVPAVKNSKDATTVSTTTLIYTGSIPQKRTFKSKVRGSQYRVQRGKPFSVHAVDVETFLRRPGFEVYKSKEPAAPTAPTQPLVSAAPTKVVEPVVTKPTSMDNLDLPPEVITMLVKKFNNILELQAAEDNQILTISGIGPKRLKQIREAVATWESLS